MIKVPLTVTGAEKLQAELHELKTVTRARIIKAIAEARAHGDLKENAEYHAAKEQQGFSEGRIANIESKLSNAQIIDVKTLEAEGKVVFGATVKLKNIETKEKSIYQIVGEDEANIKDGLISINSPIARAMVGKEADDEVIVKTPSGDKEFEILSVQYI